MQLFELMTAIGAPALQGAGKAADAATGDAQAAFGRVLSSLMRQAGQGEVAVSEAGAGGRPRRQIGLLTQAAEAAIDQANPLAGLQAVLHQVLQTGQAPTEAATDEAKTAIEAKLSSASDGARQAWGNRLEHILARLDRTEAAVTGVDPKAPPEGWVEPEGFAAARQLLTSLIATARAPAPQAQVPAANALPEAAGAVIAASAERIAGKTEEAVEEAPQAADVSARESVPAKPQVDPKPTTRDIGVTRPLRGEPHPDDKTFASELQAGAPKPAASEAEPAAAPKPVAEAAAAKAAAPLKAPAAEPVAVPPPAQGAAPAATAREAARVLAADAARGSPDTVAHLSAQIVKRLDVKSTRFDMELHPADLGRVDIQMRIEADGRLNAQLAFDNPAAAADFRGRADELRRHLEQAGFQLTDDSLSFSDRESQSARRDPGQGFREGSGGGSDTPDRGARARAFREGDINSRVADAAVRLQGRTSTGLDVRV